MESYKQKIARMNDELEKRLQAQFEAQDTIENRLTQYARRERPCSIEFAVADRLTVLTDRERF